MLRHGLFLILGTLAFAACRASGADLSPEVLHKEVTRSLKLGYLLSLPKGYEPDSGENWPLVVFLHGAGERGDLQKAGNKKAMLTVYPEAAHDSWTETYQNPELYEWLLSHSLEAAP